MIGVKSYAFMGGKQYQYIFGKGFFRYTNCGKKLLKEKHRVQELSNEVLESLTHGGVRGG